MSFLCADCGTDTNLTDEYYMVEHDVWAEAIADDPARMLCVGCLEARLKRNLVAQDFLACPLNLLPVRPRSRRLQARLKGTHAHHPARLR